MCVCVETFHNVSQRKQFLTNYQLNTFQVNDVFVGQRRTTSTQVKLLHTYFHGMTLPKPYKTILLKAFYDFLYSFCIQWPTCIFQNFDQGKRIGFILRVISHTIHFTLKSTIFIAVFMAAVLSKQEHMVKLLPHHFFFPSTVLI